MEPIIHAEEVEVKSEEILIHSAAWKGKADDKWVIDTRIIGTVMIDGKLYEFNKVIKVELQEIPSGN